MIGQLPDGLYFSLSDDDYHGQQRLSASGIKNMVVSPANFWAESWMNPRKPEQDKDWATFGRAAHKRICEGSTAFYNAYVPEITPEDIPGALVKNDALKAECVRLGLPVSGTKEAMSDRLRQFGCRMVWEDILKEYTALHQGKIMLPKGWLFDLEITAACAEADPIISKCFKGGVPEISVLWHAEVERRDGSGEVIKVPMKSRVDYLKPQAIVEKKTYTNQMGKSIKRAITYEIAARRYPIGVALYYQAFDIIQQFIKEDRMFGERPSKAWLDGVVKCTDPQYVFVFFQKGAAPVITGWIMPRGLGLVSVANMEVQEAQIKFHDCMVKYGTDPWVMSSPLEIIGDGDIPLWGSD